jgi:hypothetical protein
MNYFTINPRGPLMFLIVLVGMFSCAALRKSSFHFIHPLSSNKATGLDKISCKIIKIAALVIADSLTYIFNQAITLSSFPDEWKMARVIPLYKSGHRNIPGNYRPISILPTIYTITTKWCPIWFPKISLYSNSSFRLY